MTKWPDGTPKSTGNAFAWRERQPEVELPKPRAPAVRSKDLNASGNAFQTYSKAYAAIGNFPPVAVSRGERAKASPTTQAKEA
jgi:hypothetical protein